jgi:hypothetical protein
MQVDDAVLEMLGQSSGDVAAVGYCHHNLYNVSANSCTFPCASSGRGRYWVYVIVEGSG